VTPAPVHIACAGTLILLGRDSAKNGGKLRSPGRKKAVRNSAENWSGREDSNLRPLPPEGSAPRLIRARSMISLGNRMAPEGAHYGTVRAKRFKMNLGPCLYGGSQ
jgi:hypothetical protein